MPATFTVQMDEEEYRVVGPLGEEGACVPYGQVAALAIEAEGDSPWAFYYAYVVDPDEENPEVFSVDAVTPMRTKMEEVQFADSGAGIALVDVAPDEDEDEDDEETVP
jgi:hypothetical protein